MKLKKSFQLALNILVHSKLRSWLTIIGIVIGIGAVVSIVSISSGAEQQLKNNLGNLGADVLTVSPGLSRAQGSMAVFREGGGGGDFGSFSSTSALSTNKKNLTEKDVTVLKSLDNVKLVMGEVTGRVDLAYSSKTATVSVTGVDGSAWKDMTTETISSGRLLTQSDSYDVVLGGRLVSSTFEGKIPLNDKVTIGGKTFKVVGILESGSSVYMPINEARDVLDNVGGNEFNSILVKISDVGLATNTTTLIEQRLRLSRGILNQKNQDFSVSNPSAMQQTMQSTMNTMALFLGAIAAISLLVGAIGIANTMFTSVLEKTREIGIMKAIGAANKDILIIFLINSGLIGLVGGIGGIILGVFGSGLISYLGSTGGGMTRMFSNTTITFNLLFFALIFSVVIGMIAGAIPAYRASKLNPVDALRYE